MRTEKWTYRLGNKARKVNFRVERMSRRLKKYCELTRRQWRRNELKEIRIRQSCKHDGDWETAYAPVYGEFFSEPDYDYCTKCGMKEQEAFPHLWPSYTERIKKFAAPYKYRRRVIERLVRMRH